MKTITEDRWDEDLWDLEHANANPKVEVPRLIFYFGANVSY